MSEKKITNGSNAHHIIYYEKAGFFRAQISSGIKERVELLANAVRRPILLPLIGLAPCPTDWSTLVVRFILNIWSQY